MSIQEIQEEIIEEFAFFEDWLQRYEHIIELGKSLAVIDPKFKTKDYLIKGCQSKVWVHGELQNDVIVYTADSDAIITKGIIALLIRVYSNQKPEDILESQSTFIDEIGLKDHLSATRANGLAQMVKQIKLYAIALQTQIK